MSNNMPFGLIGDIFSSVVGARNTDKANKTNLQINRMNNEFNAREAEKAFQRETQYNDKIRAEDRAYNSAAQQVERYRQAGLNPTIMMHGQSAGMAQSNGVSSSAASAAPSSPQQAFSPRINTSGIGGTILGFLNYRKEKELTDEQLNGLRIENEYKTQKILQDLAESKSRELSNKATAALNHTIESLQDRIVNNQTITAEAQYRQMMSVAELNDAERLLKSKELSTFDERFRQEGALRLAQVFNYIRSGQLSAAQAKHEIQKEIKTMKEQGLISAQTARASVPALMEKAQAVANGVVDWWNDTSYKIRDGMNKYERKVKDGLYRYTGIKLD